MDFETVNGNVWTGLKYGSVAGTCRYGKEFPASIKGREFVD
jgi:hypothetical protein